jgi:nucleoside-diphosphate-sugar epimerase
MNPQPVLVTGAYGLIGNLLYAHLAAQPERYDVFALDRSPTASIRTQPIRVTEIPAARLRLADLADYDALARAVSGIDTIIHLAADPAGDSWESVLANNLIGARNLFEAARQAGVKRVVFASTIQVVFGYGAEPPYQSLLAGRLDEVDPDRLRRIDHTQPTRPLNDYSCSKIFGEALAHVYAYSHGLSCLCVRVGWVVGENRPPNARGQAIWCSHRDIVQLLERCLNAPADLRFDVFFGVSDNRYNLVDLEHARQVLGYAPQDHAQDQLP